MEVYANENLEMSFISVNFSTLFYKRNRKLFPHIERNSRICQKNRLPPRILCTAHVSFKLSLYFFHLQAALVTNALIPTSIFVSYYCQMSSSDSEKGEIKYFYQKYENSAIIGKRTIIRQQSVDYQLLKNCRLIGSSLISCKLIWTVNIVLWIQNTFFLSVSQFYFINWGCLLKSAYLFLNFHKINLSCMCKSQDNLFYNAISLANLLSTVHVQYKWMWVHYNTLIAVILYNYNIYMYCTGIYRYFKEEMKWKLSLLHLQDSLKVINNDYSIFISYFVLEILTFVCYVN